MGFNVNRYFFGDMHIYLFSCEYLSLPVSLITPSMSIYLALNLSASLSISLPIVSIYSIYVSPSLSLDFSLSLSLYHLYNTQYNTEYKRKDLNVLPVWRNNITGNNITVAILDDGKQTAARSLLLPAYIEITLIVAS